MICEPCTVQNQSVPVWSLLALLFKREDSRWESTTESICNYIVSLLQFTLIKAARGLRQPLLFLCCLLHHISRAHLKDSQHENPPNHQTLSRCVQTVNTPAWYQFIYWPIRVTGGWQAWIYGERMVRTISRNSRNIPEKQTLQHLPYGERRRTTANHNERWEKTACVESVSAKRARQAAIWTQALYKTHNFQLQEPGGLAYIATTCASGGSWAQLCCCFSSTVSPAL